MMAQIKNHQRALSSVKPRENIYRPKTNALLYLGDINIHLYALKINAICWELNIVKTVTLNFMIFMWIFQGFKKLVTWHSWRRYKKSSLFSLLDRICYFDHFLKKKQNTAMNCIQDSSIFQSKLKQDKVTKAIWKIH